jgi:hypothetical protein
MEMDKEWEDAFREFLFQIVPEMPVNKELS